jgi:hypothetical protein
MADVPSGLSLTQPQETKKKKKKHIILAATMAVWFEGRKVVGCSDTGIAVSDVSQICVDGRQRSVVCFAGQVKALLWTIFHPRNHPEYLKVS